MLDLRSTLIKSNASLIRAALKVTVPNSVLMMCMFYSLVGYVYIISSYLACYRSAGDIPFSPW